MEKRGQILMLAGIVLVLVSMLLGMDFVQQKDWLDFVSGMFLGMGATLLIFGFIQVIRTKKWKK